MIPNIFDKVNSYMSIDMVKQIFKWWDSKIFSFLDGKLICESQSACYIYRWQWLVGYESPSYLDPPLCIASQFYWRPVSLYRWASTCISCHPMQSPSFYLVKNGDKTV